MDSVENSSRLWDKLWTNKITNFYPRLPASRFVENFIRKQLYFKAIDRLLGSLSLENKDIIELGSGTGSNSLYIAQNHRVKSVTLVDFSEKALVRVSPKIYPCQVRKIQRDILKNPFSEDYDFAHSTGLVEHFGGRDRSLAIERHAQCVKTGGLIMVWVPISSLAFKPIQIINSHLGIKEIPFTKKEMQFLFQENGLEIIREEKGALGALYGILARKT